MNQQNKPHSAFEFNGIEDLIFLRDELHGGSWDNMLHWLQENLKQKCIPHKIRKNILEDIETIRAIIASESHQKVNASHGTSQSNNADSIKIQVRNQLNGTISPPTPKKNTEKKR